MSRLRDHLRYSAILAGLLTWFSGAPVQAQIATHPPASGLYESWSSLRMSAYGPLASAPSPLPEWIEVETTGMSVRVVHQPEGRVVWRLRWSALGPTSKTVEVDGALFLTARYEYDAAGHVVRKTASGPGLATPLVFTYQTDTSGRITERRSPVRQTLWGGEVPGAEEVLTVTYRGPAASTLTSVAGQDVRRDEYDDHGRLLASHFLAASAADTLGLVYERDAFGALLRVWRERGGQRSAAAPAVRDPSVGREHVAVMANAPVERREVLLLLGSPATASDERRGVARVRSDDYADGCWLNDRSGFAWDPTGLLLGGSSACICGLCVAADSEVEALDTVGVDSHWTRGPWLRLDDALTITADHPVMTPSGPRMAGELAVGDVMLDASGAPRTLRSVEALDDTLRLGRNLRTGSGVFAAEGFLVGSELTRACE